MKNKIKQMSAKQKQESITTEAALRLIISKLTNNLGENDPDNIKPITEMLSAENREDCWKYVGVIADTVIEQSKDEDLKIEVIFHCMRLLWFLIGVSE